eukprot:s781_g15.t1
MLLSAALAGCLLWLQGCDVNQTKMLPKTQSSGCGLMALLAEEYGAPLHLPMGPLEPQIGAVAIVNQSSEVVAYLGDSYRMGRAPQMKPEALIEPGQPVHYVDRHQKMRFEYDKGTKDQEAVDLERCELAPTPLVLAEKLKRKKAYEFLSNAWAPIATVSGISKEDLMDQARGLDDKQRAAPALAKAGVSSYPWIISLYAGRRGEDMTGLGGAESIVRFAKEQHRKFYSKSPDWAKEMPKWPTQDSLSSPAEPRGLNSTGGTWRELLGRSTWFLLHTLAARYPEVPSKADRVAIHNLVAALGQHYPCPICRRHLRDKLMSLPVASENRRELSLWLCQLHNSVNKDLHKAQHSCNSFELDLQYLKTCGECTQASIDEETPDPRDKRMGEEPPQPGHWNYFQYMETDPIPVEASKSEELPRAQVLSVCAILARWERPARLSPRWECTTKRCLGGRAGARRPFWGGRCGADVTLGHAALVFCLACAGSCLATMVR